MWSNEYFTAHNFLSNFTENKINLVYYDNFSISLQRYQQYVRRLIPIIHIRAIYSARVAKMTLSNHNNTALITGRLAIVVYLLSCLDIADIICIEICI